MKLFGTKRNAAHVAKSRGRSHKQDREPAGQAVREEPPRKAAAVTYAQPAARPTSAHHEAPSHVPKQSRRTRKREENLLREAEIMESVAQAVEAQYDETYESAPPRRRGRRVRGILLATFVFALIMTGGVYALLSAYVRPPDVDPFVPTRITDTMPDESGVPVQAANEREIFTVLVAGMDNAPRYGRTDTLMLVAIDTANGALNVVNIPRDTMVDFDTPFPKVNAVLPITRSVDRLKDTVEDLVGFRPDNYVRVNMEAFQALVDVVGPIYFDVPIRMRYDDPYANPPLHIDLQAGYQYIDGAAARQLVRFRRGYADADIGRIRTQQAFLRVVAAELLQIRNVTRIPELAGIFSEHVDTDLPLGSMVYFAQQLVGMDSEDINFLTMPGEYDFWHRGASFVLLELAPWLEMVNTYLNPAPVPVTEENVRIYSRVDGTVQLTGGGRSLTLPREAQ